MYFHLTQRSRCNSSSRCCYRAREHVDPTWSRKISRGGDSHPETPSQAMEPSRQTRSSYGPPYPLGRWSSGWLLLDAAQTSLWNVMLLAVQGKYKNNALSRMQKMPKEKQHHRIFRACMRLLCTWYLLEGTVYLPLSDYHPLTLSNSTRARGQYHCAPGFVGGPRSTTEEKQSCTIFAMKNKWQIKSQRTKK